MKNLFTNKLPSLVLLCLFFICGAFVGSAPAQLKDTVIVDGNPALKQSDVDKLQDFFEWLFEKKFSKAQKGEFQSLVIKKWQSGEMEITAFLGVLKSHTEIQALNESDREKIRQQLLPQALDTLRRRRNEINEFLTAIYENSRNDSSVSNSDQNAIENAGSGGSVTLADLAGTWSSGNVSGIRYKNLTNGDLSDVSGNMSEYIVSAKGDIQYTGYLSTTIYSCSTRLFFTKKGKISISGSTITFDYKTGERDYQNSCNASLSGVKPIPPQRKTVSFTLERSAQQVKLCTVDEGVQTCLYKVN